MSLFNSLDKTENGWALRRGKYVITVERLSDTIKIDPVFGKKQCGVSFTYMDMTKDSTEKYFKHSLKVIDPVHDNSEFSLSSLARCMLTQLQLGTFNPINTPHEHDGEYLEYLLKFLGCDPHVCLDKQIPIPISIEKENLWIVEDPLYLYSATRNWDSSTGYYITIINREKKNFNHNNLSFKYISTTIMSKGAAPLTWEYVSEMFGCMNK